MNEKVTKGKLVELLKPHLDKLFFPDGVYGGTVYYLTEDGFYGPHHIPDYVVPIYFSSEALSKFKQNLEKYNKNLSSISDDDVEKITEGIDLTYGEGWDVAPKIFVDMVKFGCKADTFYFDREFSAHGYDDSFDSLEDGMLEIYDFKEWGDLELEDIEFWCDIIIEANESKETAKHLLIR